MNLSATDDQLENFFLDPYRPPDSSFFPRHSSFLAPRPPQTLSLPDANPSSGRPRSAGQKRFPSVPMPLRGRVGQHANTGVQCQNWLEDQQTVIALLNLIPAAEGGAQASLAGRVVAGLASDALFKAILRFQKQYFPAQQ